MERVDGGGGAGRGDAAAVKRSEKRAAREEEPRVIEKPVVHPDRRFISRAHARRRRIYPGELLSYYLGLLPRVAPRLASSPLLSSPLLFPCLGFPFYPLARRNKKNERRKKCQGGEKRRR